MGVLQDSGTKVSVASEDDYAFIFGKMELPSSLRCIIFHMKNHICNYEGRVCCDRLL
jgi:hypothetical protein